jgi:4-aminobutyrate aminotransferase/diaminobutyrate-pyruvate transaminase/4-aminobutyrate aminotransferase/(S)-3-amino-2-methylpropionate transaminase
MAKIYQTISRKVPEVDTRYRKIKGEFPPPESIPILEKLREYEPRSMSGQPLVIWNKAEGFCVEDKFGNRWLDWSSGVLVANAGHGNKKIREVIINQINQSLLHNYCFPSELRAELVEKLANLAPPGLNKVFLLTTGSETTENALKVARSYGLKNFGKEKIGIISFSGAFHGRTLGAQMLGGIPSLKDWIVNLDPNISIAPFPDCYRCPWGKEKFQACEEECFANFKKFLSERNISPQKIAGVITETYQGGSATFAPAGFIKLLREYCQKHDILLIFDEIQAGFGRTGKFWGFDHYQVTPDIICCGKGITSSLPLSAVIGRAELLDIFEPGTMTSTHSGNPVCVRAAIANIEYIIENKLVENAARVGTFLGEKLKELAERFPFIGSIQGRGLVYGVHIVHPGSKNPDGDRAFKLVGKIVEKGVLLFAPVGLGGATIKICPPLNITTEAISDGLQAFEEALEEV